MIFKFLSESPAFSGCSFGILAAMPEGVLSFKFPYLEILEHNSLETKEKIPLNILFKIIENIWMPISLRDLIFLVSLKGLFSSTPNTYSHIF